MPAELAPFGAFLLATSVGLGLTALTYFTSRRAGLAPVQAALIDNLQDNVKALEDKVSLLEEALQRETAQRILLQQQVARQSTALADLATENAELRRKLGMPSREQQ